MFIFLSFSCSWGIWIRCIQIVILLCFKVLVTWFGLLSSKFRIFVAVWNVWEYWTTEQPNSWDQILRCWHPKLKCHAHDHGAIFELTLPLCAAYDIQIDSKAIYTHLSKRNYNESYFSIAASSMLRFRVITQVLNDLYLFVVVYCYIY